MPIAIIDWSTGVTNHTITITPTGGATIMTQVTWTLFSNPAQLSSVTLLPLSILSGWIIAP
jgi:hypothetical protein